MKVQIVNTLVKILGGVKIMKVTDKGLRTDLLNDYLHLRGFARKSEEAQREVVDKFNADWRDANTDSIEYKTALVALNEVVGKILSEEVDVEIKPVSVSDFMAIPETDSVTLEQVAFLMEWGVLKD